MTTTESTSTPWVCPVCNEPDPDGGEACSKCYSSKWSELSINEKMLARQCDLAREAETDLALLWRCIVFIYKNNVNNKYVLDLLESRDVHALAHEFGIKEKK